MSQIYDPVLLGLQKCALSIDSLCFVHFNKFHQNFREYSLGYSVQMDAQRPIYVAVIAGDKIVKD